MLDSQTLAMMAEGTGATLYMTLMSTLFGYILGLPMGIDRKSTRLNSSHQ